MAATIHDWLTPADLEAAATALGVTVPHVVAVAEVESSTQGAFGRAGHPTVLFERHVFHRETHGVYDDVNGDVSDPRPGGYGRYAEQPARLAAARRLDAEAAVRSCSWGLFQVMGFNCEASGYGDLAAFEDGMWRSASEQLAAWVRLLDHWGLAAPLRRKEWAVFARRYNGPGHARHDYAGRLDRAFRAASASA